jgi:3-oxoacyl-[acyl-carrier-protein] synthase-3
MAFFSIPNISIRGVSACVPMEIEYNTGLDFLSEHEKSILIHRVGIKQRRIAPVHVRASDLCYEAARRLLVELNWNSSEIDFLIFVSQTPDQRIPGTSMQLQDRLHIPKSCMAFDINQGCAGYVYGLASMASLLAQRSDAKGLLLVGDTITHVIDKSDPTLVPIFSDSGTCTALEFQANAAPMHFNLMSDGSRYDAIMIPNTTDTSEAGQMNRKLVMQGHKIFKFGLEEIAPNVEELLQKSNTLIQHIDFFIMHQANKLLNEAIRKKVGFPADKVPYSLELFGNTSCATIPLTMVDQLGSDLIHRKLNMLLSGFGVGLSWGSVLIESDQIVCPKLMEI